MEIGSVHEFQSWVPENRKNGAEEMVQLIKLMFPKNDDLSLFPRKY